MIIDLFHWKILNYTIKIDAPIEIPDSEDHIMASAYPDSKTFRGIKSW